MDDLVLCVQHNPGKLHSNAEPEHDWLCRFAICQFTRHTPEQRNGRIGINILAWRRHMGVSGRSVNACFCF
jgi:hypothetical protein